ncbi:MULTISPECIES: hypothetical protein [unclassified Streptomyces]|uniref:hypothetical protein n=1 Tax=unclassified Streptomyces TaxID=2593676 RepID=UPI00225A4029|nr:MULTISPECIES: hypothetical protein [unclassified Streptomyces]WSP58580.1 hypothetical protein OG306_32525 [Streptomyces sp. NBC_01241]WSU20842.1 hypothetical protein OG508_07470 [Streptomyces sp. NBC_01108]WTA39741.1 hypothetical protein OG936_33850 [Streptomyces sp. NBC_00846]MCX4790355.1 hypothetical protein [Streptomyces sp. NBC_01221]MCX4793919.1 hypothetical protein [Streptomyces sp. NBC_01242]
MAPDGTKDVNGRPRRIVAGIRERHQAVHELLSHGCPSRGISVDDLLVKVTSRRTLLDDFKPYIYKRFAEGCHDAGQPNLP